MDCLHCRTHVLDTWRYCPKCGQPLSATSNSAVPPPAPVSPWDLVDSLNVGLVFVTQRRRIGYINRGARNLFGNKERQEPVGKPFGEVLQHSECVAILQRCLDSSPYPVHSEAGEEYAKEIFVREGEDRARIYQIQASPVQDKAETPTGTVFMFHDITDLHRKADFASQVPYELRVPIMPIKGFIRTLLEDENEEEYDRETRREFYTIIEENADRLHRFIYDLIHISYIERLGIAGISMNWEMVDLRQAAEEALTTLRGRTDKHTFILDFEPEEVVFEADLDQIQGLLRDFAFNAIKYSPGGEIRIIARLESADEEFPFDAAQIGVKDQGMGIGSHIVKKRITKFVHPSQPGPRTQSGIGIGLYLTKALIAAHKGTMSVESEPGKGSTFWVRLPLHQPEEPEVIQE